MHDLFDFSNYQDPKFYERRPEQSLYRRYLLSAGFGILGFAGVVWANYMIRRPVFSGIQKHIFAVATFGTAGELIQRQQMRRAAEKDAHLKHYMMIHPEDFQALPAKTYGEVLLPWKPIR